MTDQQGAKSIHFGTKKG